MEARQRPSSESSGEFRQDVVATSTDAIKVREAAVDWITATCRRSVDDSRFRDVGMSLLQTQSWDGPKVTPWRFEQFEGLKTDGVGFGENDELSIIRLSGPTAAAHWKRVFSLSTNCSRLDLQVTVENVPKPDYLISKLFKQSVRHYKDHKRPPTLDFRWSNRSGHTAYYNTRASSRYGRIYNKGIESKLSYYDGCVRLETQLNKKAAMFAGRELEKITNPQLRIKSHVEGFFSRAGCRLPWDAGELSLLSSPRSRSSAQRRLLWLSVQVRGCLHELLEQGYYEEVKNALNLSELKVDQLVQ